MVHVVYKTVNLLNNKYYIGYHKLRDVQDNYLGSGKLLKVAIKKYGKEQFRREILFSFRTKEEALLKEFELVNQDVINDENSYNLKIGGEGGWDYINDVLKVDPEYRTDIYQRAADALRKRFASGELDHLKRRTTEMNKKFWKQGKFYGRKLSEDTKSKISENNGRKLSHSELAEIKYHIDNSGIEFNKFGWVSQLAKLINRKPQKVNYIMAKYFSEFYQANCFKTSRNIFKDLE